MSETDKPKDDVKEEVKEIKKDEVKPIDPKDEAKALADPYFDKDNFPGVDTSEWKRYYDTLDANRMRHIAKMAVNDKFKIRMVKNPNDPKNKWIHEYREFKYYEVTVREWQELEMLRADHTDLTQYAAKRLLTAETDSSNIKKEEWNFRRKLAEKFVELYKVGSKSFLCMTDEEFDAADWTDVRDAVDACNHRTIYSLPNSQETFMSSSTSGVQ